MPHAAVTRGRGRVSVTAHASLPCVGIPRWARQRQPAGDPRTPATLPHHARLQTSPRPRPSPPHLLNEMHSHRDPCEEEHTPALMPSKEQSNNARQKFVPEPQFVFCARTEELFFSFHERTMQVRGRRGRGQRQVPGNERSSCSLHASFVIRAASVAASRRRLGFMEWGRRFRAGAAHMAW